MILVAAATLQEVAFLTPRAGLDILVTGIGPVDAASATTEALARERYDLVVSAGIGGALDRTLLIGEGIVVSEERFELDLETAEPLALPRGVAVVERGSSDERIVAKLVASGFKSVAGVTVSRVTATAQSAARLARQGARVESMEGFAVLRASERARVRAVEVRGISNYAGTRSESQWSFSEGVRGLQSILSSLLSAIEVEA